MAHSWNETLATAKKMNSKKGTIVNMRVPPLQEELMMIFQKNTFAGTISVFFQETSSLRVLIMPLALFGRFDI
jgi:hypothetical protein